MKILSFITDTCVARRILDHLGLPSTAPAVRPARDPPKPESVAGDAFDGVDFAIEDPA